LAEISLTGSNDLATIFDDPTFSDPLPSLKTLESRNGFPGNASGFKRLPRGLNTLKLLGAEFQRDGRIRVFLPDDAKALPPNLTSLLIPRLDSRAVAHLPSSLTSLKYALLVEQPADINPLSVLANLGTPDLLPNLTRLDGLSANLGLPINEIPAALRHAVIGTVLPKFPTAVSEKLELLHLSLALAGPYEAAAMEGLVHPIVQAPQFPISLTSLTITLSFPSALRPSLLALKHCYALKTLTLSLISPIPLDKWSIYAQEHIYDGFPENLTSLSIQAVQAPSLHTLSLPSHLTCLKSLKEMSNRFVWSKNDSTAAFESSGFLDLDRLPASITSYDCSRSLINDRIVGDPTRLKRFKILSITAKTHYGSFGLPWYQLLGPSIKEVHWGLLPARLPIEQEERLVQACQKIGIYVTFPIVI
jgi:hypothetical protein